MIAVAGVVNVETTVPVQGWPVEYEPVRYPSGVATRVSGVGFNVAAGLVAMGRSVRLATFVGTDTLGAVVERALQVRGLSGFTASTDATPQAVVLYDEFGRRQVCTDLRGVPHATFPPDVLAAVADGAEWAMVTNVGFARPLLDVALRRGVPVAADVQVVDRLDDEYNAPWMAAADILFCSHERLPCPPGEWARAVIARYDCAVVVVGLGADGVLVAERSGEVLTVPAVAPRPVVNTAGAGDALAAAFLDAYAATGDARAAVERAAVFAGWKVGALAGEDGFLDAAALDELAQATFATAAGAGSPSSR